MKLTKENVSAHIEEILNDPEKKQILVDKLIESGLFDMTEEKENDNLIYKSNCYINEFIKIVNSDYKQNINIKYSNKFEFDFSSKETAELWAKKLSALNKLRMIKELIDKNNYQYNWYYWIYFNNTSYITVCGGKPSRDTFIISFTSNDICNRAIELMGKEALDDLFIEIN